MDTSEIPDEDFYCCPVCGHEGHADQFGKYCPACGANLDEFHEAEGVG